MATEFPLERLMNDRGGLNDWGGGDGELGLWRDWWGERGVGAGPAALGVSAETPSAVLLVGGTSGGSGRGHVESDIPPELPSDAEEPADPGEFVPLPEKTLKKLLEKGRQDAEELDKTIRSQFELPDADGKIRLR